MPPSAIGKNMIFWHKIVIFHTKYPKNVRPPPPLGANFLSAPPTNLKSWIRPCYLIQQTHNKISRTFHSNKDLLTHVDDLLSTKEFWWCIHCWLRVRVMVFNATFNNISAISWWFEYGSLWKNKIWIFMSVTVELMFF